jgi:hypothetical protein
MKIAIKIILLALLLNLKLAYPQSSFIQDENNPQGSPFSNSIVTDPFLPLFNSFALVYERNFSKYNALVVGLWYGKVTATYPKEIKYPGYAHNYAPILGYRRYFWKNLHAEFQLYPGYTKFLEENEKKMYHSFSLFTELRFGYKFNLRIKGLPLALNLQWPVGTSLYESNEPESFREIRKQDPIFYLFFPNIYVGFRF